MIKMEFDITDVLGVIRFGKERNDMEFERYARSIAKTLKANGDIELYHYVMGLIDGEDMIVPMDSKEERR